MNINDLYSVLTKLSGLDMIPATWIERYVDSPISLWCDLFAPKKEAEPIDEYTQHLFEVGQEHQRDTVSESYPEAIQKLFRTEEEGFRLTLEMMAAGDLAIKNMPLIAALMGLEGRPDLLVRNDSFSSAFGKYGYEVIEIKSARNIRHCHLLQAAAYNRLLGQVQEYEPEEFYIINRDGDSYAYRMSEYNGRLDEAIGSIRDVLSGAPVAPIFGTGKWPWESYVDQLAVKAGDISLIPGVGPARRSALADAGFRTIDEVARATEDVLVAAKGVGYPTAFSIRTAAQALVAGKPVPRTELKAFPKKATEVFLDLEGTDPRIGVDGLEVVNYLIGALVRTPQSSPLYVPFFAPTFDEEESNFRKFFAWTNRLDDPVFYHWHHYERTHLNKMSMFYELPEALVSRLFDNMVDISPIATGAYAFPAYGQGLKAIAKSLGFEWRQGDIGALVSVARYLQYVSSGGKDEEAKRKILDYNEDDCLATLHIFDWLQSQSAQK